MWWLANEGRLDQSRLPVVESVSPLHRIACRFPRVNTAVKESNIRYPSILKNPPDACCCDELLSIDDGCFWGDSKSTNCLMQLRQISEPPHRITDLKHIRVSMNRAGDVST